MFTSVWFVVLTLERLNQVRKINQEEEDEENKIDIGPNIAIVIGTIVGLIGVAIRMQAALQRESEKSVPRVFIV